MENLQLPSWEFTFRTPDQIGSTESTSISAGLGTLPLDRSRLQHLPVQIDQQLSQQHLPAQIDPQFSQQHLPAQLIRSHPSNPDSRHQVSTVDSSPLSSPVSTTAPASPLAEYHLNAAPPCLPSSLQEACNCSRISGSDYSRLSL